ncbi:hypothetical protein HS125_18670 [bacterium]|nr:hypothetical protein [bacterium]
MSYAQRLLSCVAPRRHLPAPVHHRRSRGPHPLPAAAFFGDDPTLAGKYCPIAALRYRPRSTASTCVRYNLPGMRDVEHASEKPPGVFALFSATSWKPRRSNWRRRFAGGWRGFSPREVEVVTGYAGLGSAEQCLEGGS